MAPGANAQLAAVYRGQQWRAVVDQLPAAALTTTLLAGLAWQAFGDRATEGPLLLLVLGLCGLNLFNLGVWWRVRHDASDRPRSRTACIRLGLNLMLAGVLQSGIFVSAFDLANQGQQLLMTGTMAAAIAAASWMFALLPHAGLGWVLGSCGGLMFGILAQDIELLRPVVPLLGLYAVVLCSSILLGSRLFLKVKAAQQAVAQQGQWVALLLKDFEEHASDWLWELDGQGRLSHVSPRMASVVGQAASALRRRDWSELLAELVPPQPGAQARLLRLLDLMDQSSNVVDQLLQVEVGGRLRWWSLSAHRLEGGQGWRGVGSDVTALRERDHELQRLASEDALTGLANRHQFNRRLGRLMGGHRGGASTGHPCTLVLLDLDNFKQVNDSLGHAAGDTLLKEVASRLERAVRTARGHEDLVARLGGDEFALLLHGALPRDEIDALLARVRAALAEPQELANHRVETRASFGVAWAPLHARDADELMRLADLALYAAKEGGRDTWRLFDAQMRLEAEQRLGLLADLREALPRGQLELHFQPQIDLANGRLEGFEALLRWRHPRRGLVPPNRFIPLAEDSGLILPIGAWVLRQACHEALAWPDHLSVAVNVSAVEFERSDLCVNVLAALAETGLAPQRLELELTESALLTDTERAVSQLHRLRDAGVKVALDDFGTGFSSLAYLRQLPLDKLKIDRAFIAELDARTPSAATSAAIVTTIQGLGKALALRTMAEGVETAAQRRVLMRLGCQAGQGYWFARPLTSQMALEFIQAQRESGYSPEEDDRFTVAGELDALPPEPDPEPWAKSTRRGLF